MDGRGELIEKHAIDFIPASERHGTLKSMFTLWFSSNLMMVTVATGIIPVELGLSLKWAIVSIIVGNLLGGIVMAAHAAQGPTIGMPQMIQSRAQFGVLGANIPLSCVVLMYIGFFAGGAILGGDALADLFHCSRTLGIVLIDLATYGLFSLGYDGIHRYARISAYFLGGAFVLASAFIIFGHHGGAAVSSHKPDHLVLATFGLAVSIAVTWQITYGPYVADYTRYLPESTPKSALFSWTYLGSVVGSVWGMVIGAFLATSAAKLANADPSLAFAHIFSDTVAWLKAPALLVVACGLIIINALNLYGASLSSITIVSSSEGLQHFVLQRGRFVRLTIGLVIGIISTFIAIFGEASVMPFINNLLLVLMYVFIPWSAINLADFYFVRRGHYTIESIYDRDGEYGAFGWPAIITFLVTIVVEIPFMSTPFFTGYIAHALNGTDITWIVGLVLGLFLYPSLMAQKIARPQGVYSK